MAPAAATSAASGSPVSTSHSIPDSPVPATMSSPVTSGSTVAPTGGGVSAFPVSMASTATATVSVPPVEGSARFSSASISAAMASAISWSVPPIRSTALHEASAVVVSPTSHTR